MSVPRCGAVGDCMYSFAVPFQLKSQALTRIQSQALEGGNVSAGQPKDGEIAVPRAAATFFGGSAVRAAAMQKQLIIIFVRLRISWILNSLEMDAIGALLRPTPYSVQALRRAGWDAPQHQHSSATCVSTSRTRVQPECEPWRQRRRRVAAGASLPGSSGSSSSGGFPAGSPAGAASPTVASPPISDDDIVSWNWAGQDEFTPLNDRRDAPPLPLPRLRQSKRLVLVRHGQSTWNARNRIQGSSDFAVLTEQGVKQAHAARELVSPTVIRRRRRYRRGPLGPHPLSLLRPSPSLCPQAAPDPRAALAYALHCAAAGALGL